MGYEFTNDWFALDRGAWDDLFRSIPAPAAALEVGCYEGQASVYLIETCMAMRPTPMTRFKLTCVDTWLGSADLPAHTMDGVEGRFDRNTKLALARAGGAATLRKIKTHSTAALAGMIAAGESFDLIFIDASHTAPDVLADAAMAFHLLTSGGVIVFDDYKWSMEEHGSEDILNMPKMAIDSFVNCNLRRLQVLSSGWQLMVKKV